MTALASFVNQHRTEFVEGNYTLQLIGQSSRLWGPQASAPEATAANQLLSEQRVDSVRAAIEQILKMRLDDQRITRAPIGARMAEREQAPASDNSQEYRTVEISLVYDKPFVPATPMTPSAELPLPDVSYELSSAPTPSVSQLVQSGLPAEAQFLGTLDRAQRSVLGWLRQYKAAIVAEETTRGVDRRAIAGAIAWEALENVQQDTTPSRAAGGPGKVHILASQLDRVGLDSEPTAAEEVETSGLLPTQSYEQRKALLKSSQGAIRYIAAIMQGMALAGDDFGFDLWREPEVLTWAYQARGVRQFREHLATKLERRETTFITAEGMGAWVRANLAYLELAVGEPAPHTPATLKRPQPQPVP